ncbi:MAG: CDP-glycerol glycerophosphotransferase family protein [Desulfonatronovibrionaceae bacterium]
MPKILFYIERDLHLLYLLPVMEKLKNEPGVRTAFCAPEFIPSSRYKPGHGLCPDKLQQLQKTAPVFENPEDFSPDVTVVGDSCHFLLPEHPGPTVNIGHGLICKGTFYTDRPHSRRDNLPTALCVPGPWHKKRLQKQVKIPIRVTGFIKTDYLIKNDPGPRSEFNRFWGVRDKAANILYAPTFNPELSSISQVLPRITDLADKDTNVLIKLHNMTPPEWFESCCRLSAEHDNIALLTDSEYTRMMHHTDLLISDVSSIFVEFMLLDKPVLLFNSPEIKNFNTFDPQDIEYQVRDGASEADSPRELVRKAKEEIERPQEKSGPRKKYRQALDYKRDGRSAQRVARVVLDTLEQKVSRSPRSRRRYLILVDCEGNTSRQTQKTLANIRSAGFEQDMDILTVRDGDSPGRDGPGPDFDRALQKIAKSTAEYIVFLRAGFCVPYKWAEHLALHMFWDEEIGIVRALGQKEIADSTLRFFKFETAEKMPAPVSAHYLRTIGIGSRGSGISGPSACVLAPLYDAKALLAENRPESPEKLCREMHSKAAGQGSQIVTALDVYVHPGPDTKACAPRY